MTPTFLNISARSSSFQYRKRYEVTCDMSELAIRVAETTFQYRKRYEVTCDTRSSTGLSLWLTWFQYRKRYEVTCDAKATHHFDGKVIGFQYRKRYEVTCDLNMKIFINKGSIRFNTASGMRSHVTTTRKLRAAYASSRFNTASGMRSHVTLCLGGRRNRRLKSWFWKTSSKPNIRSHFFGCHHIPRRYVMTPPSLMQQGLRRFEENRKTCPVFSPLRGFPAVHTVAWFLLFVKS